MKPGTLVSWHRRFANWEESGVSIRSTAPSGRSTSIGPIRWERLALGNAKFEGQLCSQLRDWIGVCRADGSDTLGEILDFLLADELPHVRNGKQWLRVVAKDDPKRQESVLAWADAQAARLMEKIRCHLRPP